MKHKRRKPDITETHPDVAAEWDHERNETGPTGITRGARLRAWWRCSVQGCGHRWQTSVSDRTRGRGCPECRRYRKPPPGRSLADEHPEIAAQWDDENGPMTPQDVTAGSQRKVWWRCPAEGCGHRWQTRVSLRTAGGGCPECSRYRKPAPGRSLADKHPELLVEWDDGRNPTVPQDVTPGSNRKVWWRCLAEGCGHRWQTRVSVRTAGSGCPECSRYPKPASGRSLADEHPELLVEWDDERNPMTPQDVTPGSKRKVWWRCSSCDHRWRAIVAHRTNGRGCPACAGQTVTATNSLAAIRPDLAAQWDHDRNQVLTPDAVTAGSSRKVWWRCPEPGCGHIWETTVRTRTSGKGCLKCYRRRRRAGQDTTGSPATSRLQDAAPLRDGGYMRRRSRKPNITETHPRIAAEWDHERNKIEPTAFTHGSGIMVWWRCFKCYHRWQATAGNRTRGRGCPACAGMTVTTTNSLAAKRPDLAEQWDHEANGEFKPVDVTIGSHKKAWWRCPTCDHKWQAAVCARTSGRGCPACAGTTVTATNSLAAKRPDVAAQWDHEANGELKPEDVTAGSQKRAWWRCPVSDCGHRWQAPVARRTNGGGCPKCSRNRKPAPGQSLADKHPDLIVEWDDDRNQMTPQDVTPGSRRTAWWRCPAEECGHRWQARVGNRTRGRGCPACAGTTATATNSLAAKRPDVAAQWDHGANGELRPEDVTAGTRRRVWWRCPVSDCRHGWQTTVVSRTNGSGCPNCRRRNRLAKGQSLADKHPELIVEWDDERNPTTPQDVTANSRTEAWWRCSTCDYRWRMPIGQKVSYGCPECAHHGRRPARQDTDQTPDSKATTRRSAAEGR